MMCLVLHFVNFKLGHLLWIINWYFEKHFYYLCAVNVAVVYVIMHRCLKNMLGVSVSYCFIELD